MRKSKRRDPFLSTNELSDRELSGVAADIRFGWQPPDIRDSDERAHFSGSTGASGTQQIRSITLRFPERKK